MLITFFWKMSLAGAKGGLAVRDRPAGRRRRRRRHVGLVPRHARRVTPFCRVSLIAAKIRNPFF